MMVSLYFGRHQTGQYGAAGWGGGEGQIEEAGRYHILWKTPTPSPLKIFVKVKLLHRHTMMQSVDNIHISNFYFE